MSDPSATQDALAERSLESERVLDGHFLQVYRDRVELPSGQTAWREYIKHPGAVVIVATDEQGCFVVERQYRYPMGRVMLEFPAGKLDPGEDPLVCAQRELQEETGFRAREWARAGVMHNAIAYSDEAIHIYFARGLTAGVQHLDTEEFLEVDAMDLHDMLRAVQSGCITDAKTITALIWAQHVHNASWPLEWVGA